MVKPAGTGSPILVISARPAPLPPNNSRHSPLPSALPAPKKYTHFFTVTLDVGFYVSQTLLQNQSAKNLSIGASLRIAHLVRTATTRPQPLLSLSARRQFSPLTSISSLKFKSQPSPYIKISTVRVACTCRNWAQPLLAMSACRPFSDLLPLQPKTW